MDFTLKYFFSQEIIIVGTKANFGQQLIQQKLKEAEAERDNFFSWG